jgi:hypothetical protein
VEPSRREPVASVKADYRIVRRMARSRPSAAGQVMPSDRQLSNNCGPSQRDSLLPSSAMGCRSGAGVDWQGYAVLGRSVFWMRQTAHAANRTSIMNVSGCQFLVSFNLLVQPAWRMPTVEHSVYAKQLPKTDGSRCSLLQRCGTFAAWQR